MSGQFGNRTLKLIVSEKWTDEQTDSFCMLGQIKEAKCWFNDFWVGMVKNGHGLLVPETLKTLS